LSALKLSGLKLWERHVNNLIEVFMAALMCLAKETSLPENEDGLNRALLFLARQENYRLLKKGNGVNACIIYDSKNPPYEKDEEFPNRESKRPDFQCGYVDVIEGKELQFTIECKRLGETTSAGWNLNKNYSCNGVYRFKDPNFGYGKGCSSGAMIGYIQSMKRTSILKQVNQFEREYDLPPIKAKAGWKKRHVGSLKCSFERSFIIRQFNLTHLWVDIRGSYHK
jgi:hypothetical protein